MVKLPVWTLVGSPGPEACCAKLLQSCPTLCYPVYCSPAGSSVHGILQARILELVSLSQMQDSIPPEKSLSWQPVLSRGETGRIVKANGFGSCPPDPLFGASSRLICCHGHSSPLENPGKPGALKAKEPAGANCTLGAKNLLLKECVWRGSGCLLLKSQYTGKMVERKVCFMSDAGIWGGELGEGWQALRR